MFEEDPKLREQGEKPMLLVFHKLREEGFSLMLMPSGVENRCGWRGGVWACWPGGHCASTEHAQCDMGTAVSDGEGPRTRELVAKRSRGRGRSSRATQSGDGGMQRRVLVLKMDWTGGLCAVLLQNVSEEIEGKKRSSALKVLLRS